MGYNVCTFVGNLGRDPEIRYTQSGKAVCNFSIAVSDKVGGEDRTEWVNIVCWEKLAEICNQYLHKGKQVLISGRMQTRKWQDKEGNDRYTTEIVAFTMQMLGSKSDNQQGGGQGGGQQQGYGNLPKSGDKYEPQPSEDGDDDDSIPF